MPQFFDAYYGQCNGCPGTTESPPMGNQPLLCNNCIYKLFWIKEINGVVSGPFTKTEMKQKIKNGTLKYNTLIIYTGPTEIRESDLNEGDWEQAWEAKRVMPSIFTNGGFPVTIFPELLSAAGKPQPNDQEIMHRPIADKLFDPTHPQAVMTDRGREKRTQATKLLKAKQNLALAKSFEASETPYEIADTISRIPKARIPKEYLETFNRFMEQNKEEAETERSVPAAAPAAGFHKWLSNLFGYAEGRHSFAEMQGGRMKSRRKTRRKKKSRVGKSIRKKFRKTKKKSRKSRSKKRN